MSNGNPLNAGTEDDETRFPSPEAFISAAPVLGNGPERTVSPTDSPAGKQPPATSSPTLPITELVLDDDIALENSLFGCLYDSKHNPDFRVRNHAKVLKISTAVSGFQSLLQAARRSEDQYALDCLHAHVLKAGDGLDVFAQSSLFAQVEKGPRPPSEESLRETIRADREDEWYKVQHECLESDSTERDVSATKKLNSARKAYEAKLDEVSSDPESDVGASICNEQHSESESVTLVEDSPDDFALLHATSSVTLDGWHAQAAPNSSVMNYADYSRLGTLKRSADFLEMLQRGNAAVMDAYSITLADLDVAEDESSMSQPLQEVCAGSIRLTLESTETLRRINEAVMLAYGLSVDDLDIQIVENERIMNQ